MQNAENVLLDRILAGDHDLYRELVDRYKRYVFTITLRILQNRSEAEEAAQDAFVKAFHGLKGFNRQSKFSTWLYRIAFNTAVSYRRRQRHRYIDIEHTVIKQHHEGERSMEKNDKKKYIEQAMKQLNEADRTALTLFYLQECSLDEIAEILTTPVNVLKVRLHRARLRMARELKHILDTEALTL